MQNNFTQKKDETVSEFPIITKFGEIKWVEQNVRISLDKNQRIKDFHCIVRDIDLRKEAETALLQAMQMAEDAKQLQEKFLANMSHEIRTPLNGIFGVANLLADTSLTEKQKEYVSAIQLSGNNLMVIINDILDLTKIQAGKMTFEKIPLNIREVIKNAVYTIHNKANEKGVNLSVEIGENIPKYIIKH